MTASAPFRVDSIVLLHSQVGQFFLVAEKACPGMAGGRVGVLFLELPPVPHVRVVHRHLAAHFGQLAHDDLRAAVAGVAHVLAVGGPQKGDFGGRHDLAHVAQGIAHQLGHVQGAGVVDVDGRGGDLENVVLKAHQGVVGPDAQARRPWAGSSRRCPAPGK